jgi:hypothetical protein
MVRIAGGSYAKECLEMVRREADYCHWYVGHSRSRDIALHPVCAVHSTVDMDRDYRVSAFMSPNLHLRMKFHNQYFERFFFLRH